jgi:hypothetical protein
MHKKTNSLGLLNLPNEIIRAIIYFLSQSERSRSSLLYAVRTCRALQALTEPVVYEKVRLISVANRPRFGFYSLARIAQLSYFS